LPITGPGGLGIRIAEVPSEVQGMPYANAYIVFNLRPSKTYSEKIAISNTTNSAMNVSLFPESATNIKGVFQPIEKVLPNGLASWTTVDPKSAKLPAHTEFIAAVTIKVPADAISGQQYGVIWAATSTYPNSNAIGGVSRVGIRMYDQVGDTTPEGTRSPTPSAPSTASNKSTWVAGHMIEIEWVGISLLFLLIIIIGAISVRRERKRAEKRRRKQRD
jgi:hypothetical protein